MYEYWNYSGYGYCALIAKCPKCGHITILKTVEDYWLKILNEDGRDHRYYEYDHKRYPKNQNRIIYEVS